MHKAALTLAIIAAALAVWSIVNQSTGYEGAIDDLADRLAQVEASMSWLSAQISEPNERGSINAMLNQDPDCKSSLDEGPFPTLGKKMSTLRKLRDTDKAIYKQLAELKRDMDAFREEANKELSPRPPFATTFHSASEVASTLNLDEAQTRKVESILADSKDELNRLRDEPNESGDTMRRLEERLSKALEAPGSNIITNESGLVSAQNLSRAAVMALDKITVFPESKLLGRNQTYRMAAREIRNKAFSRIENTMTDVQRTKWRRAYREPLLPMGDVFVEANATFASGASKFEVGK